MGCSELLSGRTNESSIGVTTQRQVRFSDVSEAEVIIIDDSQVSGSGRLAAEPQSLPLALPAAYIHEEPGLALPSDIA